MYILHCNRISHLLGRVHCGLKTRLKELGEMYVQGLSLERCHIDTGEWEGDLGHSVQCPLHAN